MLDRNKISGCCETVISVMAQHIDHLETMIQISYDDRARLEKELAETERKNRQLAELFSSIKEQIGAPAAKAEEAFDKPVSSMQIKSSTPSDPFDLIRERISKTMYGIAFDSAAAEEEEE